MKSPKTAARGYKCLHFGIQQFQCFLLVVQSQSKLSAIKATIVLCHTLTVLQSIRDLDMDSLRLLLVMVWWRY